MFMVADFTRWDSEVYALNLQVNAYPYDRVVSKVFRNIGSLPKPLTALDLGSGTGNHSKFLAENKFDVTAIETSQTAIDLAVQLLSKSSLSANFIQGDITKPLDKLSAESKYSLILDRGSLTHNSLEDFKRALQHCQKLLNPDGGIFLSYLFSDIHPAVQGAEKISPNYYTSIVTGLMKNFPVPALFLSQAEVISLFDSFFSIKDLTLLHTQEIYSPENSSAMWEIVCESI